MSDSGIQKVVAWEAFDSRGRPTVACKVLLSGGGSGRAIVPSGASTGSHEAREKRDGGKRYNGFGVKGAVQSVNVDLAAVLHGIDAGDQGAVDALLVSLDHDQLLGTLGSNAILSVSIATMLAFADQSREPVWKLILEGDEPSIPMPMVNIISGGAHAGGAIDIQDVLVIPVGAQSFSQAIEWASLVRQATADLFARHGYVSTLVADEGGLAGPLPSNETALQIVTKAIGVAGFEPGKDVMLAIDLAANQFSVQDKYRMRIEETELSPEEWINRLVSWCNSYPILSVEDPLHEDDWHNWQRITSLLGGERQILGDDLFATNLGRLDRGVLERAANAVLIKPNQAGTISRTKQVIRTAKSAGFGTVVSARSGDTEDYWLADLAVGWHAGQIKVGSTHRSERTSKWNRLLEIEAELGSKAAFGYAAFHP